MSRARDLTMGKRRPRGGALRPPFARLNAVTLNPHATRAELAAAIVAARAFPQRQRTAEGLVVARATNRLTHMEDAS